LGPCDGRLVCARVASRCIVEALAAREGLIPPVSALPRTIVVERAAFELSDADVVEERLEQARHVAARERELDGLERPREPRVYAEVDRQPRELVANPPGLPPPVVGQRTRHTAIALHAPFQ